MSLLHISGMGMDEITYEETVMWEKEKLLDKIWDVATKNQMELKYLTMMTFKTEKEWRVKNVWKLGVAP